MRYLAEHENLDEMVKILLGLSQPVEEIGSEFCVMPLHSVENVEAILHCLQRVSLCIHSICSFFQSVMRDGSVELPSRCLLFLCVSF